MLILSTNGRGVFKIVIATHNKGKLEEFAALLKPYSVEAVSAGSLGLPEPAETENTFAGNARIKALSAMKASGLTPEYVASSTDANVAMSIGIPAITMASGTGDRAHALDEWLDVDKPGSMRQLGIILTTVLATAGVPAN